MRNQSNWESINEKWIPWIILNEFTFTEEQIELTFNRNQTTQKNMQYTFEKVAIIAWHSQEQRNNEIFTHFQFHDFALIPLQQQFTIICWFLLFIWFCVWKDFCESNASIFYWKRQVQRRTLPDGNNEHETRRD